MDEQIKIKILKYFDHGLQKHFYKNKEERFIKKHLDNRVANNILSKKGRYKNG
jgi:hypothetical protein